VFQEEPESQKLKRFLLAQHPDLSEEKIEELTSRYAEFGLLLIRIWFKKHPKSPNTGLSKDFDA